MLSSRMGCSRFAHALLTLAEVPFESLRATAHALLTLCSRCSRFGGGVYFDEETPPCHTFFVPNHVYPKAHSFQAADSSRQNLKFALSA